MQTRESVMKKIILMCLFSSIMAFDFYGLKPGMSYDEVVNEYFNFNIEVFCDIYIPEYKAKNSYTSRTIEKCLQNDFKYYTKSFGTYSIDKLELKALTDYGHILKSVPYLTDISLIFTPQDEALIYLFATFNVETANVGYIAFEKILKDKFPDAVEITDKGKGEYSVSFVDEATLLKWTEKYYNILNTFK